MLRKIFPSMIKPIICSNVSYVLKTTCNSYVTSSNYWNNEKSVLADPVIKKPETPEKFHLQSVLTLQQTNTFEEIQKLRSVDDVIKFLESNKEIVVQLYAPVFKRIFQILQSDRSKMDTEFLLKSPEFEKFCQSVKKSVRALRPSDILCILKTLKFLNVSTNSILSQNLLQVLSKAINELNINQIIFTDFLVSYAPSSPIVEAIKISLPIVFDANVRAKLYYSNPKSVIDALKFAASRSSKSIDLIVDAALALKDEFTYDQCKDIAMTILYNKVKVTHTSRKQLYLFCMNKVKEEMDKKLSFVEINRLISFMVNSFLFVDSFFYDESLISKASEHVIKNKLSLVDCGAFMRTLNRISYVDLDLINYVDSLLSQTKGLENMPGGMTIILSHIAICSDARYLPPNWETYEQPIVDYFLNMEEINIPLVRVVLELVSLDRWHVPLVNKVFAEDFMRQYLNRKQNNLDYYSILNLYQAVMAMKQYDFKVLPPPDVINIAIKKITDIERISDLTSSLELLFGGKSYVVKGIVSKYGHFIDNLLVLNKNGQPLPIKEEDAKDCSNLEDIVLPTNGYAFAIIMLSPTCYCIDGIRVRGKFKLYIDTFASVGVIPVPISATVWESLQDFEKLPYLKQQIFSRVPGGSEDMELFGIEK